MTKKERDRERRLAWKRLLDLVVEASRLREERYGKDWARPSDTRMGDAGMESSHWIFHD